MKLLALLLLAAPAQEPMLVTTIADVDKDQWDFLTGWEPGWAAIADVGGLGVTRYEVAPRVAKPDRPPARRRIRRPVRPRVLVPRTLGARPQPPRRPPDRRRIPRRRPR